MFKTFQPSANRAVGFSFAPVGRQNPCPGPARRGANILNSRVGLPKGEAASAVFVWTRRGVRRYDMAIEYTPFFSTSIKQLVIPANR